MRLFNLTIVVFALWANTTIAQNGWISAGLPGVYSNVNCLFKDTISDRLYASGFIPNPWMSTLGVLYYDGFNWITIGNANQETRSITRYNNDIIVSGAFTMIGGVNVNYIARFDGINWHPFGNFNSQVIRVKVLNSELYAMGSFTMVDSVYCRYIAKWNGLSWQPVFNFPYNNGAVSDAEIFQGDLYVGGNFDSASISDEDIVVYKNGSWQTVGNGIQGFASAIEEMLVYKNELYVGGLIWRSAGNIGDGIQKWDGSNWSDLGMGLKTGINPLTSQGHVYDMKIFNDELYVTGLFAYADSLPAKSLAKWDGEKWCNFPTSDFVATNLVVNVFHDTIFTGCGYDTLNGDTINYLAKMLSLQPLGCRVTGVAENNIISQSSVEVFPNPATNSITVKGLPQQGSIEIYNTIGQLELKLDEITQSEINIEKLQNGLHYFKIYSNYNQLTNTGKFVKIIE